MLLHGSCEASPSTPVGACGLGPGGGVLFRGCLMGELGARTQRGVECLTGVKALQAGGEGPQGATIEASKCSIAAECSQLSCLLQVLERAAWPTCVLHQH